MDEVLKNFVFVTKQKTLFCTPKITSEHVSLMFEISYIVFLVLLQSGRTTINHDLVILYLSTCISFHAERLNRSVAEAS
jgi:hypothetical protein